MSFFLKKLVSRLELGKVLSSLDRKEEESLEEGESSVAADWVLECLVNLTGLEGTCPLRGSRLIALV